MKQNRKNSLKLGLMALLMGSFSLLGSAHAEPVTISEKEVQLNVDISSTKVKLSSAGYVTPVVKVLVPELADVTILDHRNAGENAPCLATYETLSPEAIIQNNPTTEKINFKVTLQKDARLTSKWVGGEHHSMCEVSMLEHVAGTIRGFHFVHDRVHFIGNRDIADCR